MILFHSHPNLMAYSDSFETIFIWIFVVVMWCVIWGFVTKAIVKGKGYENSGAWFWCGFFLGIIGVIVAACKPAVNNQILYNYQQQPQTSSADELMKYKMLLEQGAITQEEYDAKKKQILNI